MNSDNYEFSKSSMPQSTSAYSDTLTNNGITSTTSIAVFILTTQDCRLLLGI